jgi:hypothetical protein
VEPDLDGFRDASVRFRESVGRELTYLTPTATVWPPETPLDPETGAPYDPVVQPLASGFASASVTTLVVGAATASKAAEEVEAAIGRMEKGDAALVVSAEDYASQVMEDATLVLIYDETWEILDSRADSVGGPGSAADRVIIHARFREKTAAP